MEENWEDKWVVMYDCYGIETHNFGFVETTDFKTFTPLGHLMKGVMKTENYTSPKNMVLWFISRRKRRVVLKTLEQITNSKCQNCMNRKISILSAYIIISLLTGAEAGNPCRYTSTDNMFWEKSG